MTARWRRRDLPLLLSGAMALLGSIWYSVDQGGTTERSLCWDGGGSLTVEFVVQNAETRTAVPDAVVSLLRSEYGGTDLGWLPAKPFAHATTAHDGKTKIEYGSDCGGITTESRKTYEYPLEGLEVQVTAPQYVKVREPLSAYLCRNVIFEERNPEPLAKYLGGSSQHRPHQVTCSVPLKPTHPSSQPSRPAHLISAWYSCSDFTTARPWR